LTQKDVDIGFAGRFSLRHGVHAAISSLQPGDEIKISLRDNRYELFDLKGRLVGRLAKAFRPPNRLTFVSAQVIAIVERYRDETAPEYQSKFKCDKWEVILPELVYATDTSN